MAVTPQELHAFRAMSDELSRPIYDAAVAHLPDGTEWFDAHTHIGDNDPDGFAASADVILATLDRGDHRRALTFPFQEPDGYPAANDRVIADAEASDGRLVPLARLDPNADPLPEARRSIANGARGFKLHPRGDGFSLHHDQIDPIFALANEHGLPIMIHAGRGIPALGRDTVALAHRYPDAKPILAHAGISDLSWIWRDAQELPNLFFDTAWWAPADLMTLFALVPPGNILYASDAPYGSAVGSGLLFLRCALTVGVEPPALASIAGGQLTRIVNGEPPADIGPAPGPHRLQRRLLAERVETYLIGAIARAFIGADPSEQLNLARIACDVPDDVEEAPLLHTVDQLTALAERIHAARPDEPRAIALSLMLATCLAATPGLEAPEIDVSALSLERTSSAT
jgi:hypothetical protein